MGGGEGGVGRECHGSLVSFKKKNQDVFVLSEPKTNGPLVR